MRSSVKGRVARAMGIPGTTWLSGRQPVHQRDIAPSSAVWWVRPDGNVGDCAEAWFLVLCGWDVGSCSVSWAQVFSVFVGGSRQRRCIWVPSSVPGCRVFYSRFVLNYHAFPRVAASPAEDSALTSLSLAPPIFGIVSS